MDEFIDMKLKCSSILNVPIQTYIDDFTFIVNGEEFQTSRLVSDLISKKISSIHQIDPTFDHIIINTKTHGDFSNILKLAEFDTVKFSTKEEAFIIETIEKLEIKSIDIETIENKEINFNNIFSLIKLHSKHKKYYMNEYLKDIEFISSHFYELIEKYYDEMNQIDINTIYEITSQETLRLKDEDQLLNFVNFKYKQSKENKILYEKVIFINVSSKMINEFVKIFDFNDMSSATWISLSNRLKIEIKETNLKTNRYEVEITYEKGKEFDGIIKSLTIKNEGKNLHDVGIIKMTSSSFHSPSYHPKYILDFNNHENFYNNTKRECDFYICFDFIDKEIEVSKYSIRSCTKYSQNQGHIKNWVIEVSNNCQKWTEIDKQKNCSELNSCGAFKTFDTKQKQFSRYIRFRHEGKFWGYDEGYGIRIDSFELFGRIKKSLL